MAWNEMRRQKRFYPHGVATSTFKPTIEIDWIINIYNKYIYLYKHIYIMQAQFSISNILQSCQSIRNISSWEFSDIEIIFAFIFTT